MSKVFGDQNHLSGDGMAELIEANQSDDLLQHLHNKQYIFQIEIFNNADTILYKAHVFHPDLGSRKVDFTSDSLPFKSFLAELFSRIVLEKNHKTEVTKAFEGMMTARAKEDREGLKKIMIEIAEEMRAEKQNKPGN